MAKANYNDGRAALSQLLKDKPAQTPMQEVRPVVTPKPDEPEQVRMSGYWVPPDLARKVKVHAAETGESIRNITVAALEAYFAQIDK